MRRGGVDIIEITDAAAAKIKEFMKDQEDVVPPYELCLRIKITGGGCSGLKTEMGLETVDETELQKALHVNGIYILLDPKSALYLIGARVEYVEGLMESGFSVIIPGAKNKCGCGKSWN